MNDLIYPRERTLSIITLIFGSLIWAALIVGTIGVALVIMLLGFIVYLFAQSTLIAQIRGNGVLLTKTQFPDLYAAFESCCDRLEIENPPDCYIINGGGVLNAFATRFLGHQYVVLHSDAVDAMSQHPDGVRFYIGHELGHLKRKHLTGQLFRWPVLWLPILGAAYSRAKESTCDRHGAACCSTPENAARALAALSAGSIRWATIDSASYLRQAQEKPGFWMSFHELTAGYPWLKKRFARVSDAHVELPSRNGFAYILAIFSPYTGRLGGGFGIIIFVYIIGVLAAIALPAYQDYTARAQLAVVAVQTQPVLDALAQTFESSRRIPESLESINVPATLSDGSQLTLDSKNMVLSVNTSRGELVFVPRVSSDGHVMWSCINGEGMKQSHIPPGCRAPAER